MHIFNYFNRIKMNEGKAFVNEKEFKKGLKSAAGWLRHELGQAMSLRFTPELVFEVDHSIEYGAHISQVINSLDIRHDEDESHES